MTAKLNESGGSWPVWPTPLHSRTSEDGQLQVAVAYLRSAVGGDQGVLALVEQQNAIQRFADDTSYKVIGWYVEGNKFELKETVLSRLMSDVVYEGREFNTVLVSNPSRLSRSFFERAAVMLTLREHGVDLVSVSGSGSEAPPSILRMLAELAELNDGVDAEGAG